MLRAELSQDTEDPEEVNELKSRSLYFHQGQNREAASDFDRRYAFSISVLPTATPYVFSDNWTRVFFFNHDAYNQVTIEIDFSLARELPPRVPTDRMVLVRFFYGYARSIFPPFDFFSRDDIVIFLFTRVSRNPPGSIGKHIKWKLDIV